MKTIAALCFMVLLGLVAPQNGRGPCGCKPVFEFCANDHTTCHSICEYKCKHPSTPFNDWYILYDGPCVSEPESSTEQRTTTKRRTWSGTTDWHNPINGMKPEFTTEQITTTERMTTTKRRFRNKRMKPTTRRTTTKRRTRTKRRTTSTTTKWEETANG